MSKRFGRQQKRRMREEIERLEARAAWLERDLYHLREISRESRRAVELTASILGRYFVGLPVCPIESPSLSDLAGRIEMDSGHRYVDPGAFVQDFSGVSPTELTYAIQELTVIGMEAHLNRISGMMHARITFDDHPIGYAIDKKALLSLPPKVACRMISEQVVPLLAQELLGALEGDQS